MKQLVDIQTWERKSILKHFGKFQSPDYSVAVQVHIGINVLPIQIVL